MRIEHTGRTATHRLDVAIRSDAEDFVAFDRQSLRPRLSHAGEDITVVDDEIHGVWPLVVSGSDNETRHDRADDDDRNEQSSQSGFHDGRIVLRDMGRGTWGMGHGTWE